MPDPKKSEQQEDLGNNMSDRAGEYDESDSGEYDTPTFGGAPIPIGSDMPEIVVNPDGGTGTSYGPGNEIPPLDPESLPGES